MSTAVLTLGKEFFKYIYHRNILFIGFVKFETESNGSRLTKTKFVRVVSSRSTAD